MSRVRNNTPFACHAHLGSDHQGRVCQYVIAKGTWSMRTQALMAGPGAQPIYTTPQMKCLSQLQLDPIQQNVLGSRIETEIEWLPSDLHAPKPLFDFIVCGYAWTNEPQAYFGAWIDTGDHPIGLVLHAPRYWKRPPWPRGGGVPGPHLGLVMQVPVHPAFAYGGFSPSTQSKENPDGMGFPPPDAAIETIALPWIEHPQILLKDRASEPPPPVGFGPWPAATDMRQRHAGTYDDTWRLERSPLPPHDFNLRYFNQADPRLQWAQPPTPGKRIDLHGLSRWGCRHIVWPKVRLALSSGIGPDCLLKPDTCIVDTESDCFTIVWRAQMAANAALTLHAY